MLPQTPTRNDYNAQGVNLKFHQVGAIPVRRNSQATATTPTGVPPGILFPAATSGGNTAGGNAAGGFTAGGDTAGGDTAGGNTAGGPAPPKSFLVASALRIRNEVLAAVAAQHDSILSRSGILANGLNPTGATQHFTITILYTNCAI